MEAKNRTSVEEIVQIMSSNRTKTRGEKWRVSI